MRSAHAHCALRHNHVVKQNYSATLCRFRLIFSIVGTALQKGKLPLRVGLSRVAGLTPGVVFGGGLSGYGRTQWRNDYHQSWPPNLNF